MAYLPTEAKERKTIPLWSGLFKYFPDALVEVARLSYIGNLQHNPGQPLHWAREKSTDQEDTILRHLLIAVLWTPTGFGTVQGRMASTCKATTRTRSSRC